MRKLTTEEFINKAKKIKPHYDYSNVKYTGSQTKVKITCDKGHEFRIEPRMLISGQGCAKCSVFYQHSTEQFIEKAKNIKPNYDYSKVDYTNSKTKVKIICDKGHEFEIRPHNLFSGQICSKRSRKPRHTTEEWILEAKKIKPNYDYNKVDYINSKTKVKIICNKGHEFRIRPTSLTSGSGCAKCASSKGEEAIREFLKSNIVEFSEQKRFKGCKNKKSLPFDFYLPHLKTCIEFDGEQHFRPIGYFGGIEAFEQNKINDFIKDTYCINNNINLIRIAYNEDIINKLKESLNL